MTIGSMDFEPNYAIAFALASISCLATLAGGALVFYPSFVKYASRKVLAASLGASAGCMLYVSFLDTFRRATRSFLDAGESENAAFNWATMYFFSGVTFMVAINSCVSRLMRKADSNEIHSDDGITSSPSHNTTRLLTPSRSSALLPNKVDDSSSTGHRVSKVAYNNNNNTEICGCCSEDPVASFNRLQMMVNEVEVASSASRFGEPQQHDPHDISPYFSGTPCTKGCCPKNNTGKNRNTATESTSTKSKDSTSTKSTPATDSSPEENRQQLLLLLETSYKTALALILHNIPEGLATFVAVAADPVVGSFSALAIILHNVPEGLCVAMPIYYATGNKRLAFLWSMVGGVSELVGALVGWLILSSNDDDDGGGDNAGASEKIESSTYGAMFALTSGIMVLVAIRELLPVAHRYDNDDTVVTNSMFGGMAVMALSLVLVKL